MLVTVSVIRRQGRSNFGIGNKNLVIRWRSLGPHIYIL